MVKFVGIPDTKKCSKCGKEKNANEFHKDPTSKIKLHSSCKECVLEYRMINYDELLEYHRIYNQEKKEIINEKSRIRQKSNPEYEAARQARWRKENPDKIRAIHERSRKKNHDKIAKSNADWRMRNRDKCRILDARWRLKNREKVIFLRYIRKGWGYKPLNKYSEGLHFHHLHKDRFGNENHSIGIYIPNELHKSIPHNSNTWKGMDEINKLAWEWLENQGTKNLNDFIKHI